jgi:hypothetical protein
MANYNVTMPRSQVSVLPLPSNTLGFNRKFTVKFSDIKVAAATGATDTITVQLGDVPAPWLVAQAMGVVRTAFAGAGGLTVQVGTSGTANAFLAATSILTTGIKANSGGVGSVGTLASSHDYTTAGSFQLVFTNSVSGSPSALTAGEVDVYITVVNPTLIDNA